jgi:hypothetical protein
MGIGMRLPAQKSGTTLTLTPEDLRRRREPVPDLNTNQFETIDAAVNRCAPTRTSTPRRRSPKG